MNADGTREMKEAVILDMYAVENVTGKVIASGRRAWSDLGTREYREAAGE